MSKNERKPWRPILLVGTSALLLAAAAFANEPNAGLAAQGSASYTRYCRVCHGDFGEGDGALAGSLRATPTDLTTLAEGNEGVFPLESVIRAIDGRDSYAAHGTKDMPAWGDAFKNTKGTGADTPEQAVEQLAHYIWQLQKRPKEQ